jgi:hypothetical protein
VFTNSGTLISEGSTQGNLFTITVDVVAPPAVRIGGTTKGTTP